MVAKREIASILRCDLSLIISEFEMEILQTVFKVDSALLHYLPLLVDSFSIENQEVNPAFEERNDFVFIGNFLHEPNWNAVQYLNETIWPLIRKALPESNLYIYGAYPPQKALQLHKPKSGFHVLGRAASAKEVISKAKILLAPLRFGAGIKGKLLEAMLYGTPSITTTIGAESMYGNLPWNGFVTNEPLAFADAAIQLIQDKNTWMNAQQNGYKIIEKRYLKSLHSEHCFSKIEYLSTNLPKHRQENFTGSMLLHHTLNSTKYLSRWIEAKNK
jgi:glycosyltransferase involved in cell wall biosynthesis